MVSLECAVSRPDVRDLVTKFSTALLDGGI